MQPPRLFNTSSEEAMEQKETYLYDEAHASASFYLTFTAEEVGTIAVMAIQGLPASEAIPRMPHYTQTLHAAYSAFWEDFSTVITGSI
jgi:hypothetical protein